MKMSLEKNCSSHDSVEYGFSEVGIFLRVYIFKISGLSRKRITESADSLTVNFLKHRSIFKRFQLFYGYGLRVLRLGR